MTLDPRDLQDYLRSAATAGRDIVDAGALLVTIDPHDDLRFLNYAVPAGDARADGVRAAEREVRRAMAARERLPRVEAVPAATPGIVEALLAAGWELESRVPVMNCGPGGVVAVDRPPGLELVEVTPGDDPALVRELLRTPREAFGEDPEAVDDARVARWRDGSAVGVLARLYGIPASAGSMTGVADGLAEVAGIGTRVPYRGRGLAAAVTAALARAAFARGARTVFLSPGDEHAGRVYARAGFRPDGEVVALVAP